jgi:transcriptional regulator with GAF, ATPase, and Fis domain
VRELENSVERACALSSGPILHLGDLPTQLQQQGLEARRAAASAADPDAEGSAPEVKTLADLERQAILSAIRTLNGDKLKAAGHRQNHALPQAQGVRHRRPASGRVIQNNLWEFPSSCLERARFESSRK